MILKVYAKNIGMYNDRCKPPATSHYYSNETLQHFDWANLFLTATFRSMKQEGVAPKLYYQQSLPEKGRGRRVIPLFFFKNQIYNLTIIHIRIHALNPSVHSKCHPFWVRGTLLQRNLYIVSFISTFTL